jgi:hypothetical protein
MSLLRFAALALVVLAVPALVAASPVLLGVTRTSWQLGNLTDGSSNTIRFGETTSLDVCVPMAAIPTGGSDGTSNTIRFTETQGVQVNWTSRSTIIDGTSNTVVLSESPCYRGIVAPLPVVSGIGTITDGTSNTIQFGENTIDLRGRSFDVCFSNVSRVTDGTSNTIQLGEPVSRQCYTNVAVGPGLDLSVPAPAALPLLGLAMVGWIARRRRG